MKFTKEEIALCKKIAEKYKRKCNTGDFVQLGSYTGGTLVNLPSQVDAWEAEGSNPIPLWQISDCFEFFQERALYLDGLSQIDEEEYMCTICETDELGIVKNRYSAKKHEGRTPLEALLKAVLAILEEPS